MKSRAMVLGAGMVGVCTALQLVRRGWEVVLVDRRGPGTETSYGNAGIIQREAMLPYAFPRDARTLMKVALGHGIDVHYHLNALVALTPKLVRYWWESSPRRYAKHAHEFGRLIEHALDEHATLIARAGAEHLIRRDGWLQAYRTPAEFDVAAKRAEALRRDSGITSRVLDCATLNAAEPGLRQKLEGAIHWTQPWTVRDPGRLVEMYAELFVREGGQLLQGDAMTLVRDGHGWRVDTPSGQVDAPHAVIALGPWAEPLTRRLGYRLPLFIKRGYHRHYEQDMALARPLLDAENGIMLAPMERGLRITTGAEFARPDAPPTPVQLTKAESVVRELVSLGTAMEGTPWMGARPCTADMKPVIGAAPHHPGLWFHFGHGHQGFTLGPVGARLLAELMSRDAPIMDPTPYSPQRFTD